MASGAAVMLIDPTLAVMRFAQLRPGDLFIYPYKNDGFVALKVEAPDGDNLFVPMGPRFPDGLAYPRLLDEPRSTIISFGKGYTLQLPTRPECWRSEEPSPDTHCIVVGEDEVYVRASFVPPPEGYKACYIALKTGTIVTAGSGHMQPYTAPRGPVSFALEWELVTQEPEPRRILAHSGM
jgi:hypothetical protein